MFGVKNDEDHWPELEDFGKVEITRKKWGWTVDLLVVLGLF